MGNKKCPRGQRKCPQEQSRSRRDQEYPGDNSPADEMEEIEETGTPQPGTGNSKAGREGVKLVLFSCLLSQYKEHVENIGNIISLINSISEVPPDQQDTIDEAEQDRFRRDTSGKFFSLNRSRKE